MHIRVWARLVSKPYTSTKDKPSAAQPAALGPRVFSRGGGLVIIALYLVMALAYNVMAPPFESPDEVGHFFTVKYIADHGRLPVPEKDLSERYLYGQEGTQPPLYYLGGALILRLSGLSTDDVWGYLRVNPHTTCGSPDLVGNKGFLAHDPAREAVPWQDSILALHLLRLYSTALGLATVIGVYATARLCFPDRPIVAPLAAALTGLNPQFLFVSAGVNNDNLVVPLCVWSLYLMLRILHRGLLPLAAILTGLLIGLATLTKMAGLLLLPLACLAIPLAVWLQHQDSSMRRLGSLIADHWSLVVGHWALIVLPVLLLAGWWYVRNAVLYGDPTLIEHHLAIVSQRDPTPLLHILHEVPSIFYSYWGRFSCDLSPGGWYYAFWGLVMLTGLVGIATRWRQLTVAQRIGLLLLAVWFPVVFAGWFRWNLIASGVQGRLLFPATVSVSVLAGGGLAVWMKHRLWAAVALVLACLALALWVPLGLIRPAYAPPPRYPDAEGMEIPHRMDGIFGSRVALLGYDVQPVDLEAGQTVEVTLYLSAPEPLTDTYSMGLQLVSAIPGDTTRLAGLDTWPGDGNYPTLAWQPGEVVADTYRLTVPDHVPRAQAWMVQLNVYRMGGDEGWLSFVQDGQPVGKRAILGGVRVGASASPEVEPKAPLEPPALFGEAIALHGAEIASESQGLRVTLWWEALASLDGDYTVFVHLVEEDGHVVGTGDGPPLEGGFPTRLWRAGDEVVDEHVILLPPDLRQAAYTVVVGWYHPVTGVRLPALRDGQRLPQDAVVVGSLAAP